MSATDWKAEDCLAVELPDGRYTRGQVHAVGSKYNVLQGLLPKHDLRYKAVLVSDGLAHPDFQEDEPLQSAAFAPPPSQPAPFLAPPSESAGIAAPAEDKPKPKVFFGKRG